MSNDLYKARPTSHTYFSERLRLHYLDWGNPDAPHVLLVHGVQDHCHSWDWIAQELCRDYHVIAPDMRGHGDSEWSNNGGYGRLSYVYDLAQLIHQEQLEPVHLVSHSMGGSLACLIAGLYPDKVGSLVSAEGVGIWPGPFGDDVPVAERVRTWIDGRRELAGRVPRRYPTLESAYERMQKSNPHLSDERARHLTIHGSNRNEDGTYSWKFDNYTHSWDPFGMPNDQVTAIWESITCPTLLINAKQGYGHRTGQEGTIRHFENARMVDVDDAGHWVHHDQPEHFMALLTPFLAEHAQA